MKNGILVSFGKRIREKRMALQLSQEQLAEKAGVHRTYVGMLERAEKNVTLTNIERIAKALGVSVHELLKLD